MIGIGLKFLTGRFHATPWGRHVNEGAPEWPPSPWRFLRTLVATWKGKLEDTLDPTEAEIILRTLAEPPEFLLPPASASHTRHYMPWFKKGPGDKTLVFDAFVAVSPEAETVLVWPDAILTPDQRHTLHRWLQHLGYFGRAEAWCEGRLLDDAEAEQRICGINSRPLGTRSPEPGTEIVRVLCANPAEAFANDKFFITERKTSRGGAIKETSKRVAVLYDPDWHLCGETLWLHEERWSDPPGSRWVRYTRRTDCFKVIPRRKIAARHFDEDTGPQVARFSLDSAVLPLVTDTLPIAEDVRWNLMGIFGRLTEKATGQRKNSSIFSGKSDDGVVCKGHGHAYYLLTDEPDENGERDGRLDHLTIVTADGFGDGELRALDQLRMIKNREREESEHPLRVLLLGLGRLDEWTSGPLHASKEWVSATPFLTPLHPKNRGSRRNTLSQQDFLIAMLREELTRRPEKLGRIDPSIIERIEPETDESGIFRVPGNENFRPLQFKRFRKKRSDDGGRRLAGTFRIFFTQPVKGPIALGHSSHFGLGLFTPATFE